MKISNNRINYSNISFAAGKIPTKDEIDMGKAVINNIRNTAKLKEITKGPAPLYLRGIGKLMRKLAPFVEKIAVGTDGKPAKLKIEDLVNIGNIAKELVCMVVYPLQVLTNPDLPKDKRRFVGLYDFYVTCFSLAGTALFAWKGTPLMKKGCELMMKKYKNNAKYPKALKAVNGGAFVLGIALQTILFKRILAPALSPPLAAATRRKMDERDAKKEGKTIENKDCKQEMIPPENNAALAFQKPKQLLK